MQGWKRRSSSDERMEERIVFYKYHREGEGHEGGWERRGRASVRLKREEI